MEHDKAQGLVSFLKSAYPHAYFPPDSMATYADLLTGLTSSETAYAAIRDLIDSQEDLPSFALIRETYVIKRQRQIDAHALPEGEPENVPPTAVFLALLGKLQSNAQEFEMPTLAEAGPGRCDDCGHDVQQRYRFGNFALCLSHTMARIRVANALQQGRHELSYYRKEAHEAAGQAQGTEKEQAPLAEEHRAT